MVAADRLLRLSILLRTRTVWTDWGRRAPLRASRPRDAGAARLDHADSGRPPLARKASSVLLAGNGRLSLIRCAGLGSAIALGRGRVLGRARRISVPAKAAARASCGRRLDDGVCGRNCGIRTFGLDRHATGRRVLTGDAGLVCMVGDVPEEILGDLLFLPGLGRTGQRARGSSSRRGSDCAVRGGSKKRAHCPAHSLDTRGAAVLSGGLAVVSSRSVASAGVLPRFYPRAQSGTLWQQSLSPRAAVLVLPARGTAGTHSVECLCRRVVLRGRTRMVGGTDGPV